MAFIIDDGKNAVINHSKNNRYGKELKITEFTRDDIEGSTSGSVKKTAKELIAEIESATDAATVQQILTSEQEGEKRKTVIEAAEKKLNELKQAE
jgi:hypothetical protein